MKSILERKLTYKALAFMHSNDNLVERILEEGGAELEIKHKMKNICAMMPATIVDRLETTLRLLNMTKRDFLEAAVLEALDKADEIMAACGVDDALEQMAVRQDKAGVK
jgi:hypothetical protein